MAASQPFGISCRGGLNTNLNQLEMLAQPGVATELLNFEVNPDGGYRRINGYSAFGSNRPNGGETVLGLKVYADGVVVCSGTGIFFSVDGASWLQLNKASVASGGDNFTTFSNRSVDARTGQAQVTFTIFEGNSDYGQLIITDGINKPFLFNMTGTGGLASRTFFAEEVTVSGSTAPTVCVIHDSHLVVAGAPSAKNTIFYSGTLDPASFSSTGSGSILLPDQIVGIKSFRNDLMIFCRNSIHKLININNASTVAIIPVTQNVGCLSSHSIQEIGGDLVFLSPDGIRSVAGTARIGDVELGSVSRQIQSVIATLANSVNTFTLTSTVLRSKSQYRLFFSQVGGGSSSALGIIGTLTPNGFEWSETKGIQATGLTSGFNKDGVENTFHGDNKGYIYNHDTGNSFSDSGIAFNISAKYTTPNYDFGDIGTRKTLYYVKISVSPEGQILPSLRLRYDYESLDIPQPPIYPVEGIPIPSAFGSAIFAAATFGGSKDPMFRQAVEGSGHVANFRITSDDQNAPYAINGLYVDYVPSGRR